MKAGAIGDNGGRSRTKGPMKNSFGRGCAWPVRAIVTDGPRADCKEAISLIQNLPCKVLLADRGYDSDGIIACKKSGICPVIPPRKTRKIQRAYDENLYKNATASKTLSFA